MQIGESFEKPVPLDSGSDVDTEANLIAHFSIIIRIGTEYPDTQRIRARTAAVPLHGFKVD